jgi:NADH-quinone oxidoreductase subunit N
VLTTLGTFGMILFLSREGFESDEIDDLAGLARRSPGRPAS